MSLEQASGWEEYAREQYSAMAAECDQSKLRRLVPLQSTQRDRGGLRPLLRRRQWLRRLQGTEGRHARARVRREERGDP